MSMNDYETAKKLMARHPERMDFVGQCPNNLVETAEQRLGLKFPPTYRRFLLEYGAGSFGGEEFYGIIDSNYENSGVPDAIWYTLTMRNSADIPSNYVVIYSVGTGELFCLDVQNNSEAPIVAIEPGCSLTEQYNEIIAEDFGALFLSLIAQELAVEDNDV